MVVEIAIGELKGQRAESMIGIFGRAISGVLIVGQNLIKMASHFTMRALALSMLGKKLCNNYHCSN